MRALTASRAAGCKGSLQPFITAPARRKTGSEKCARPGIHRLHESLDGCGKIYRYINAGQAQRMRCLHGEQALEDPSRGELPWDGGETLPGRQREHFILVCVPWGAWFMVGELIDGLGDECPTSVGATRQRHGASWDLKRFKDPQHTRQLFC